MLCLKKMRNIRGIFLLILIISFLGVITSRVEAVYEGKDNGQYKDYVSGEMIVKFKPGETEEQLEIKINERVVRAKTLSGRAFNQMEELRLHSEGQELPEEKLEKLVQAERNLGITKKEKIFGDFFLVKSDQTSSPGFFISSFSRLTNVESVEPNYLYHVLATPNDEEFGQLWGMQNIQAEEAWDKSTGSKIILAAVVDSGVDDTHPDLINNIVEVKSFTSCAPSGDQLGHGTHVSGTIGGVGNNSIGVAGVNWQVGILGYKTGCRGDDLSVMAIANAINYAVSKGARVINLSLGGEGSSIMQEAIAAATQAGVIVVASAGNDAGPYADVFYPASDPNVITVSATGPNDELARYSSYGNSVDVAAPGGNPPGGSSTCKADASDCILSTWTGGGYKPIAGTSMSAPHVTGLVALILSVNPDLTADQVKEIIYTTADDLGIPGKDAYFGYGRINAVKALAAVQGGGPSPTTQPTATVGPTPTITRAPTNNPTATLAPSATPTTAPVPTLPPVIPTPTLIPDIGAPSVCPDGMLEKIKGNANCDEAIDVNDFNIWKEQWEVYFDGGQISGEERTADFDYQEDDDSTKYITLSDFEFWRRRAFALQEEPTETPEASPTEEPTVTPTVTPRAWIRPTLTPTPTNTETEN